MKKTSLFLITAILALTLAAGIHPAQAKVELAFVADDNILESSDPNQTSKCTTYGNIGSWASYDGQIFRYIAKLDLDSITTTASEVTDAIFKIDRTSTTWDDNDSYVLHQLTSDWDPASVTWNNPPSHDSNPIAGVKASYGIFQFDITDMVKSWLSDPSSNHGILIKKVNEDVSLENNNGLFVCADYSPGGSEDVPVLEVYSAGSTPAPTGSNNNTSSNSNDPAQTDAYRSIVQVKTFTLDTQHSFGLYSQGSGVIISSDGLLLTNHHVAVIEEDFDNTQRDAIYQICIPDDIGQEPDCSYMAKLIAFEKDHDIALLKIENIPGLSSQTSFPYLELNPTDTTKVNDPITALGYPAIGGDTITITNGVVSGKMDLYGKKWIKTDAVISYGSSGGAAIDTQGKVVGITSQAHFDTLGTLGYIINIVTLNDWINGNIAKSPQSTALTNRLIDFTKKQHNLTTSNLFTNLYPPFSITKPTTWEFGYDDENILTIQDPSDNDSGIVGVMALKNAYQMKLDSIVPVVKRLYGDVGLLSVISIIRDEPITLNGYQGKKLTLSIRGEIINTYMFPIQEYMIQVLYDYGTNDQDKLMVDNILNSFQAQNSSIPFNELKQYSHSNPPFSLTATGNWVIQVNHSKINPIVLMNKNIKEAYVDIGFDKADDDTQNLNNDEYLAHMQQQIKDLKQLGSILDLKTEIKTSNAHYSLTDQLNNIIMMESVSKSATTDQVITYSLGYVFKAGDKFIALGLDVYTDNQTTYQNAKTEFNQLLQSFSASNFCSSCGGTGNGNNSVDDRGDGKNQTPNLNIDQALTNRLKGYLLLQVEQGGRIWWVNHDNGRRYEVTFANALDLFRSFALGITNDNLAKIKSNIDHIDPAKDSDGDGFTDRTESASGYNPFSSSITKVKIDNNLAQRLNGKLLLQTEDDGRIWYVAPKTLEKHEVTWSNLMDLFRSLALGITDSDLNKIAEN